MKNDKGYLIDEIVKIEGISKEGRISRKNIDDLILKGVVTKEMTDFLRDSIKSGLNIIVAGCEGLDKTTILNALTAFIKWDERVVVIEAFKELHLELGCMVHLKPVESNIGGERGIGVGELIHEAVKFRPIRIIIDEIRGGETIDMLRIVGSGASKAMTTMSATDVENVFHRLIAMAMQDGLHHIEAKGLVAEAVDLVIYVNEFEDGQRKVTDILSVEGMIEDGVVFKNLLVAGEGEYKLSVHPSRAGQKIYEWGKRQR